MSSAKIIRFAAPLMVAALLLAATACDSTPSSSSSTPASTAPVGVDYSRWAAGRSTPVADAIYPDHGNAKLDVLHYGLELDWSPSTKTLTGTATVRVRPVVDADEIRLDFHPYTLDAVTVDGVPAKATVANATLQVPVPVVADRPLTLMVRYHGKPKSVFIRSARSDIENLGLTVTKDGALWTMQEPYGAFTWYPVNDHPSDKALYDIAVTAPVGWAAVASGTPDGQEGQTFKYHSADPVASYLTTLAVGKYTVEKATGPHGLPLTYWYRDGDHDLLLALRKSPKILEWLEKRFGPYPFASAGAVLVDSTSAMETQEMLTLGADREGENSSSREIMVVHEYAHQWFGDTVTTETWTDLWLNEGWATYAQVLYQQDNGLLTDLQGFLDRTEKAQRERFGAPGHPRADAFAVGNVYYCAASMLHEIHKKLGDAAFFDMARAWVQENRNTSRDRADFVTFVNKHTGRDFTALIDEWLDSSKTPKH